MAFWDLDWSLKFNSTVFCSFGGFLLKVQVLNVEIKCTPMFERIPVSISPIFCIFGKGYFFNAYRYYRLEDWYNIGRAWKQDVKSIFCLCFVRTRKDSRFQSWYWSLILSVCLSLFALSFGILNIILIVKKFERKPTQSDRERFDFDILCNFLLVSYVLVLVSLHRRS